MLTVSDLSVTFERKGTRYVTLDRVSFAVAESESVALVGESGSGKSTFARALVRLLPQGARVSGRLTFAGADVLRMDERALRSLRGRGIALVFPDPLAALDPVRRVGSQIAESMQALDLPRVAALLASVGLRPAAARLYPHQLSGGMRQRVLIAAAIASSPKLLVADEPTSALDPVARAQLVSLLRELRTRIRLSLLVATHDIALAELLCERIAVLYAGRIVEAGPTAAVLARPRHPYTAGLLASIPPPLGDRRQPALQALPGTAPAPWALPSGCRFRDRCPNAQLDCASIDPLPTSDGAREVACLHPLGGP